jgi:sugar O-acyltransferase (sialic acid O-acetyltransferase NeuD family)
MTTLYLCGGGNPEGVRLALNIHDASGRWDEIVLLDDDPKKHGQDILGVPVIGGFDKLAEADVHASEAVNLVARSTRGRRKAAEKIASFGIPFASLVDPTVDTRGVELGDGVTVYRNATVSARSRIGDGAVVFPGANAGHGSSLGAGSVLAPGAVINARVVTGEGAYVGTNASVLPDLKLGAWCTIAANSSVLEDVPEGATVLGVPGMIVMMQSDAQPAAEPGVVPDAPMSIAPDPFAARPATGPDREPDGAVAELVARIWADALSVEQVRLDDNFFDLGGTSLLAVQVRGRLQDELHRAIAPTDVFRFPTVRRLAAYLSGGTSASPLAARAAERGRLRRQRLRT